MSAEGGLYMGLGPETIALLRIGQLLITSLLGFGSIFLGYRLFAQIPILSTAEGQIKMPRMGEVKLKAGPGVFFALLGAFVIYSSIDRAITISSAPKVVPEANASGAGFTYSKSRDAPQPCLPNGFSYDCRR
jgi:hypothetical protein